MKHCNKCNIDVQGHLSYCPLCQNQLVKKDPRDEEDLFPDTYNLYTSQHMFLKVLGFIAITISLICITINFFVLEHGYWSLIVVAALGCIWLSLAIAISKHRNILKYLLYQCLIICLFTGVLDYLTGWSGWSIDIVVPIVFTVAVVVMYLLTKLLRLKAGDYIIYLLLDVFFGILPFVFLLLGIAHRRVLSIICIAVSLVFLSALIIFEGRTMLEELNKRLHI